jgi:type I restriction enzyme S subunit
VNPLQKPRLSHGWKSLPLKHVAWINSESLPEDTDPAYEMAYVDIGGVTLEHGIQEVETVKFGEAPSRARRRVSHGDTLVSTVRTYLRAIAPVIHPPKNMVVSTGFAVIRSRGSMDARFLSWALRGSHFVDAVVSESVGVSYPAIAPTVLARISICCPEKQAQIAIADFLDRETAKIDTLIAKQAEFLTLLDEHRRALVTEALTHGLDSSVPMRETDVPTFPRLPVHWRVKRLKHVIRPGTSISYGIVQPGDHDPEGIPFVQTADLTQRRFDPGLLPKTAPAIARAYPRSCLNEGDVLLGIRASVGDSVLVPPELHGANLSRGIARIVPGSEIEGRFLVRTMEIPQTRMFWAMHMQGSTFREISIETVRELPVPVAPLSEQKEIIRYLEQRLASLETTRSRSVEMIDRLRERRSALITAAVTGQIDVTKSNPAQAAA